MKTQLQQDGLRLKGFEWPDDDGWFAPRAGMDIQVPYAQPLAGGVLPTPTYTSIAGAEICRPRRYGIISDPAAASSTCYSVKSRPPATLPTENA